MSSEPSVDRLRPLLATLLPALLYAATLELLVGRVLAPRGGLFSIPGRQSHPLVRVLVEQAGVTLLNFAVMMAVAVIVVLGVTSLRAGPGRRPRASWVGPGLILIGIWSIARIFFHSSALDLAYQFLSLGIALGILSRFFAEAEQPQRRAFAVLGAAALACGAYVAVSSLLAEAGGPLLRFHEAGRRSGEILSLACGALVPALLPWEPPESQRTQGGGFPQATLAAIPAGLFLLLFTRRPPPGMSPRRWDMGWSWDLLLPDELLGLLYAGVLFLVFFILLRALSDPRWRIQGYGLAFLFLAGVHYRTSYQHLLGLLGLLLLTRDGGDHNASTG
jgi:hypothetical protein